MLLGFWEFPEPLCIAKSKSIILDFEGAKPKFKVTKFVLSYPDGTKRNLECYEKKEVDQYISDLNKDLLEMADRIIYLESCFGIKKKEKH
jgi:hypothetical protein